MVAVLAEKQLSRQTTGDRDPAHWPAKLGLAFVSEGGRTRMRRTLAHGPLHVQKPFYPEQDVCHVYLLHPPGGIAGGDTLRVDLSVGPDAAALVTTPAASKFYRCGSVGAEARQSFRVESEGSLEWLPQETIFFGGCRALVQTRVELAPGARYIGMELNCLGRPAAGDQFAAGSVDLGVSIIRVDHDRRLPLLVERNRWQAGGEMLSRPWGLGGRLVCGSLYATPVDEDLIGMLQARHPNITQPDAPLIHALTGRSGVLIARVLGNDAEAARDWLRTIWAEVRPFVVGRSPCPPRIWCT